MEHVFRVFDFNVYNETKSSHESSSDDDDTEPSSGFKIQIFGVNEQSQQLFWIHLF